MLRRSALFVVALMLAACSPRGEITVMPAAAAVGEVTTVFVGTTRAIDDATGRYGRGRSLAMRYASYGIAIPPDRAVGEIRWPGRNRAPNPRTDFLTTSETFYDDGGAFRRDLSAALRQTRRGQREAIVFVHGFNNTFSEGLYRLAQLTHDLEVGGVSVHYSWPSAGQPLRYAYDRDSALFARDGLETLLSEVSAAGAERILIVAHSLGSALTMETLRQMAIRGSHTLDGRQIAVALISPDIDVDVFRAQALAMGKLPQPFYVFTSRRDRALALSARLTGQADRLGNVVDIRELADLDVTLIDVGAFSQGSGHFNVGNSPGLIRILSRLAEVDAAFSGDQTGRPGLLPRAVLTVQGATQVILAPVTALAESGG